MAQGDVTWFEEPLVQLLNGTFATTNDIKVAVLDNTTTPTATDAAPDLSDYTEVGEAGTYTAGGTSIGTLTSLISEAGGVATIDSDTNPTWAQDASNDTDAYWGLIYNDTSGDIALAFVDLGGPVDMQAGDLTITWNASGIATVTIS